MGCMILFGVLGVSAQDYHFTDFRMAPSILNPALTGAFEGTYRINGIYRDQWRSFGESNPYKTVVLSGDINVKGDLLLDNDWISAGLSLLSDQAGTGGYKTTITGMRIGYHLGLDNNYNRVISIGVSYGSAGISATGFTLQSDVTNEQPDYRQSGGPYLPSVLSNPDGGPKGTDLSAGMTYKLKTDDGALVRFGLALNHLNRRDATVVVNTNSPDSIGMPLPGGPREEDPIFSNFVIFGEGSSLLSSKVRLNPALLFMKAGDYTQLQLQTTAEYLVNPKEQFSLTGGLGIRAIPFDAAYLIAGVKIKDLSVRLSYDLTLSSLRELGGGNSFELSVGYIGRIYKDPKVKPVIFCPRL